MSDAIAQSAIEAMRTLTQHIDQSVESLLDAHAFSFSRMDATTDQAAAYFSRSPSPGLTDWHLVMSATAGGRQTVNLSLTAGAERPICLEILVGQGGAETLAKGTALALSFIAICEQVQEFA